jgi:O-antigen ligase
MWRARPLTGVGPDNFRRLYAGYLGPKPLDERVRTNSLYVGVLAETGLLGGLALVSLLGALAQLAVSGLRARPRPPLEQTLEIVGSTAALAALLLYGLLDDLFHMTATATLFWILAGLLVASVRRPR